MCSRMPADMRALVPTTWVWKLPCLDIFTLFVEARLCDEFVPRERLMQTCTVITWSAKCRHYFICIILNSSSVVRPLSGEVKDFSVEVLNCFRRGSKNKWISYLDYNKFFVSTRNSVLYLEQIWVEPFKIVIALHICSEWSNNYEFTARIVLGNF